MILYLHPKMVPLTERLNMQLKECSRPSVEVLGPKSKQRAFEVPLIQEKWLANPENTGLQLI